MAVLDLRLKKKPLRLKIKKCKYKSSLFPFFEQVAQAGLLSGNNFWSFQIRRPYNCGEAAGSWKREKVI